ncbi:hypothetical protein RHGRI_003126 [Rhododendron griersonianum]|uniref:peptidylprolyl isomerase n=1 Tax=Rhododendron griersonianum TaxID=479676 RepID=A0AAV6LTB2_9ERIC|nr:hypothetical protein RHGRI_003126 [Rhododendron griersonianum]
MIHKFPDLRRLDHLCEEYFEPLFGILDCCFRIALLGHVRFYFNCQGCCGSFDFVALGVRLTCHGEDQTSSSTTTKQEEEGSKSYQCYYNYCVQLNCDRDGVFPVCYLQTLVSEGDNVIAFSKKTDVPRYAILNTSKGSITVELYKEGSPEAVDEFIDLCQRGHFKGMPFHHVIKNFVIQGGNTDRPGATDDWTLRGKHNSQLDTSVKHEAFMLGTSKAKHDKEAFELYITTAPIPDLNEKLIVFGRVIRGEDVVQEIEEVDTDEHYRPKSSIGIINVSLKQKIGITESDNSRPKYRPGIFDDLFLNLFRNRMEVGWDSEKPGYDGLIEVANRLMMRRSNSETKEAAVRILRALFPPLLLELYRMLIAPLQGGKVAAIMVARVTALSCQWLMGPCAVNNVDLPDGSSLRSGVFVERCKYLEESKCVGICINTCKLPTQTFFKDYMGVPLLMEPNFSDYSCQSLKSESDFIPPRISLTRRFTVHSSPRWRFANVTTLRMEENGVILEGPDGLKGSAYLHSNSEAVANLNVVPQLLVSLGKKVNASVSPPNAVSLRNSIHSSSQKEFETTERNTRSMNFVRGIIEGDRRNNLGGSQLSQYGVEYNADIVHIKLMCNNTFVTVTDSKGNKKFGASSGMLSEMKGGPKLSRYAAEATAEHVGRLARNMGLKTFVVKVNGFTYFKKKK